jgi:hypothetical protein
MEFNFVLGIKMVQLIERTYLFNPLTPNDLKIRCMTLVGSS